MRLIDQVVSLELAKRLKELGVKQEGASYWWYPRNNKLMWQGNTSRTWESMIEVGYIAAFTVPELGEMLPMSLDSKNLEGLAYRLFTCWNDHEGWSCAYCVPAGAGDYALQVADTEADARAKMLVYLIENKLLKV